MASRRWALGAGPPMASIAWSNGKNRTLRSRRLTPKKMCATVHKYCHTNEIAFSEMALNQQSRSDPKSRPPKRNIPRQVQASSPPKRLGANDGELLVEWAVGASSFTRRGRRVFPSRFRGLIFMTIRRFRSGLLDFCFICLSA
jgi:hypothetical protein